LSKKEGISSKELMPDPVKGEAVSHLMADSRGRDSNVELKDTRINETYSPM
jgi:hypothetical protein